MVVTVTYLTAYVPLHGIMGSSVGILATVPVVMAGLMLGVGGGFVAGALALAGNGLLETALGADLADWGASGGVLGGGAAVLVGTVTGYLRDLSSSAALERDTGQIAQTSDCGAC